MPGRMSAAERTERIMSIVPWLVVPGGVSITETCERFQIDRAELLSDLDLLFYNVGVHPFTPDALVEVFVDEEDDTIEVNLHEFFVRPLRLSPDEALTIVGAAKVLLASRQGSDVLASAVAKIEHVLSSGDAVVGVELASIDPEVFAVVRSGLDEGRVIRIEYHSFGRDEVGVREVEGQRVLSVEGRWYLQAWCRSAGDHRVFRLDRILSAALVDERVDERRPAPPGEDDFDFTGSHPLVRLVLGPEDEWVPAQYPTESVERLDDGRLAVELESSGTAWLERLLLRLDPNTEAVDVETGRSLGAVRTSAAARILRRYR